MLTKSQLMLKNKRNIIKKIIKNKPFHKSVVYSVFILTPRKPNSAKRRVVKVSINGKFKTAYIPGKGNSLSKHSVVLVRGGNIKDLPGVKHKLVRGKFDLKAESYRGSARSKYGIKKA
jgi:small subunit ribosomal protein S12